MLARINSKSAQPLLLPSTSIPRKLDESLRVARYDGWKGPQSRSAFRPQMPE